MEVILDTNFLMAPHQHKIDIFSELDRVVPDNKPSTLSTVVSELKNLSLSSPDAVAAKVAVALIEERKIPIHNAEGDADDSIVEYATKSKNVMVATNDKALKGRLRKKGVRIAYIRGKNHLEVD